VGNRPRSMSDVVSVNVILPNQLFVKVISPDENTMKLGLADTGDDFGLFRHLRSSNACLGARILGQTVLGSQLSRTFLTSTETKSPNILSVLSRRPIAGDSAAISGPPVYQKEYANEAYPGGDSADDLRIG
jgi:hypothetical protein